MISMSVIGKAHEFMFYRESALSRRVTQPTWPCCRYQHALASRVCVLFVVVAPLVANDYNMSILNLILIAVVGASGEHSGWLHRPVSIGMRFMSSRLHAANLIVRLDAPFWIAVPAEIDAPWSARWSAFHRCIKALPRDSTLAASHHRMDDQHVPWISGGTQSRFRCRASVFGGLHVPGKSTCSVGVCRPGDRRTQNLIRSRIGRAFIAIRAGTSRRNPRHQYLPIQTAGFRISSFYAAYRRAVRLYSASELRAVPTRRLDQLPGDVDHRGLDRRLPDFVHFVTLATIVTRRCSIRGEAFLRGIRSFRRIPSLRLVIFGALIIFSSC